MSQEILKRAVELVKKGIYAQALDLLRPLVGNEKVKPFALAAMAFSYQREGNLSVAKYLYAQAIRLQPDNTRWADLLAKCAEVHNKRIEEARAKKPGGGIRIVSLLLCLVGGLFIAVALLEPVAEVLYDFVGIDVQEQSILLLCAGGAFAAFGLILLIVGMMRTLRYKKTVRTITGEDFSDKQHVVCPACDLRHLSSAGECPFCGTARKKPKPEPAPEPEAEPEAAPQPEPVPAPVTVLAPEPAPAAARAAEPKPAPAPLPETQVQPAPVSQPETQVQPAPQPESEPQPEPESEEFVALTFAEEPEPETEFVELTEIFEESVADPPGDGSPPS